MFTDPAFKLGTFEEEEKNVSIPDMKYLSSAVIDQLFDTFYITI